MEHLGHCLQCHLCEYHTYRSVDFKPHLTVKHPGRTTEWYEPLPNLSNIVATEVDPKDTIIGIKEEEPMAESDSDSNSDKEWYSSTRAEQYKLLNCEINLLHTFNAILIMVGHKGLIINTCCFANVRP